MSPADAGSRLERVDARRRPTACPWSRPSLVLVVGRTDPVLRDRERQWISIMAETGRPRLAGAGADPTAAGSPGPSARSDRTARARPGGPASAVGGGASGAKATSLGPQRGQVVERPPDALGQPGQGGRAQGGGLDRPGPHHREAGLVGHAAGAAGPWPTPHRRPGARVGAVPVAAMASTTSRTWKPMASTMARARWARPGAPAEPDDGAPGAGVPAAGCPAR